MHKSDSGSHFGMLIILGSVWGLSEAALGMGLRSCAAAVSGSLMTGAALLFLAAGWAVSRRVFGVFLMVFIASIFKLFDALLLSLPIQHGAIGNPIFAFFMEAIAFVVLVSIIKEKLSQKPFGQALLGGMTAAAAANLFPLVGYATGVSACAAPGTTYPLSLYYIHFAVLASFVAVPLGFWLGTKMAAFETRFIKAGAPGKLQYALSPTALIICAAIVTLLRLS